MRYLIGLLLFSCSVAYSDTKIIIGGLSNHSQQPQAEKITFGAKKTIKRSGRAYQIGGLTLPKEVRYNEIHPAIGIESNGVELTAYYNSLRDISYSLSKIITNQHGYGARLGVAWYDRPLPVMQFGYFAENYDITFGYVSTLTFKVNI